MDELGGAGSRVQADKEAARGPVAAKKKNADEEDEEVDPTVSGGRESGSMES